MQAGALRHGALSTPLVQYGLRELGFATYRTYSRMIPAVDLEQTPFETEVDIYQRELRAPSTLSNLEVLPWWQAQESRFPNLARMVRQFLACPASSASAERIFSLAGRLFDDKSQAMKEENLEDRMWAKQHVLNQRAKKL